MTRAKFKFGAKSKKIQKSSDTKKAYIQVAKPIDNFAKIK